MEKLTKQIHKNKGCSDECLSIAITYSLTVTVILLIAFDLFSINTKSETVMAATYNAPVENITPTTTPTNTPTPTPEPTATPTPTPSPTPTPTPMPETPEEWYTLALNDGTVLPAQDSCLTRSGGVYQGPSGRETYYNLNMDLVVQYMRDLGYSEKEYPYWVREDGCKMLGNYIIVAANFSIRPKGTILETSLGTAIVCDTGSFVNTYPEGIDIAVNW